MGVSMRMLATLFISIALFSFAQADAQEIPQELFHLERFFSSNDEFDASTKRSVANHLVSLAIQELNSLKAQKSRGLLGEDGISRMEMLYLAVGPIHPKVRPKIAEIKAYLKDREAYLNDPKNSLMIFNSLGQDRISGMLMAHLKDVIKSKIANKYENSFVPPSILNDETVRGSLKLTAEQQSTYEQTLEKSKKKIRFGNKQKFDELEKLYDDHLDILLLQLSESQRELAKGLIGEPVKWFKARSKLELLGERETGGLQITINGKFATAPDGRPMHELAPAELEKLEVPHIHQHLKPILSSHFFASELDLTESQFKQMGKVIKDVFVASRHQEQRFQKFLAFEKIEYPSELTSILVEHQLDWLPNIEFQILTVKYRTSFGLMHPKVIESLKITSNQSDVIADLSRRFEHNAKQLSEKLQEQRKLAEEEFQKAIEELLTKDQKEKLKNWGSKR